RRRKSLRQSARVQKDADTSETKNGQHPETQLSEVASIVPGEGGRSSAITSMKARKRRPEMDRLWPDWCKRRVDAVAVYRYDRFDRSLRQSRSIPRRFWT